MKEKIMKAIGISIVAYGTFKLGELYGTFEASRTILNSKAREYNVHIHNSFIDADKNRDGYVSRIEHLANFLEFEKNRF